MGCGETAQESASRKARCVRRKTPNPALKRSVQQRRFACGCPLSSALGLICVYLFFSLFLLLSCNSYAALPTADEVSRKLENLAKGGSHCRTEERIIFTCSIDRKTVSVCSSNNLKDNAGYVQYRYGILGKVELTLPKEGNTTSSTIGYKHDMGASYYAYYLRFTNENYKYYVYAGSRRGDDDPKTGASTRIETSGMVVMKGDKVIQAHKCSGTLDYNVGEHFWGANVPTLTDPKEISPLDFAFPPNAP